MNYTKFLEDNLKSFKSLAESIDALAQWQWVNFGHPTWYVFSYDFYCFCIAADGSLAHHLSIYEFHQILIVCLPMFIHFQLVFHIEVFWEVGDVAVSQSATGDILQHYPILFVFDDLPVDTSIDCLKIPLAHNKI